MPTSMPMPFLCKICGASEHWTTRDAAQAAAVWHVYNDHREAYVATIGEDRPPKDPVPENLGRQLAPWQIPT